LLHSFGGPIAAPSANRFGRVSATRAEHVLEELDGIVDLILDGGQCQVGLESTIIDLTAGQPRILRPGAVTREQIEMLLGSPLGVTSAGSPRVSGSLPSHYAPRARVEIVIEEKLAARADELSRQGHRVAILATAAQRVALNQDLQLPLPTDSANLAHGLYELLRQVDRLGCDVALVTLPADDGLGTAIADRLRRAAGPRSS
jgi:L-threonylcarbamoyladenylate synthase